MTTTKPNQAAERMRKFRKDHPDYDRKWYDKNREILLKRMRKRYRDDDEYRAKRIANAKARHKRMKELHESPQD